MVSDLESRAALSEIVVQLKITNMHLGFLTDSIIGEKDVD